MTWQTVSSITALAVILAAAMIFYHLYTLNRARDIITRAKKLVHRRALDVPSYIDAINDLNRVSPSKLAKKLHSDPEDLYRTKLARIAINVERKV